MVYFESPGEVSNKVEAFNKLISKDFENTYQSYMDGKWFSHIAVWYQSPMPKHNESKILSAVEKIATDTRSFDVTLKDFVLGSSGYVFVDLDDSSKKRFHSIYKLLRKEIGDLKGIEIAKKYLERWESFSDKEKLRVKETGRPYQYQAHISVAKVAEDKNAEALKLLKDKSLGGYKFTADRIKVLDFYNNNYKLIGEFLLENKRY